MLLQLFDAESSTWTYLLADDASREALLIGSPEAAYYQGSSAA
jgi:hypothetical protein